MNKKHLIIIGIAVLLVLFLFFKGMLQSEGTAHQHAEKTPGMLPSYNPEKFFENALQQIEAPTAQLLKGWQLDATKARNPDQKMKLFANAARYSDSLGFPALAGYFYEQNAVVSGSLQTWLKASNRYTNAINFSNNPGEKNFLIEKGKTTARMVLTADAGNMDAQNLLAQCIIYQSDDSIMTVVPILKGIESRDSTNIAAIYNLAMLSMKSGQTDKAEARFRKLIRLEPMNAENYFRLAEIMEAGGKIDVALQQLEICKSLLNSPAQIKAVEDKIKDLKH